MAQKPKTSGAKTKTDQTPRAIEKQFERFKETARALDADDSTDRFEQVFRKIVPPK